MNPALSPTAELKSLTDRMQHVHLDRKVAPVWSLPVVGTAAGLMTWSFSLEGSAQLLLFMGALAILCVVTAVVSARQGVLPDYSNMPARLRSEVVRAWVLSAILAVVVLALFLAAGAVVAAVVAGLGFMGIMYDHQQRYDTVSAELRATVE